MASRSQPWRVMTREEYDALKLLGPHLVEHDWDGFGATAVWLYAMPRRAAPSPTPPQDGETG